MKSLETIAQGMGVKAIQDPDYAPARVTGSLLPPDDIECDECWDAGFVLLSVPTSDPRFGKAQPCGYCAGRRVNVDDLIAKSGVPVDDLDYSFEFYKGKPPEKRDAAIQVYTMTKTGSGFAYISGDYGIGKSGLLKAASLEMCRNKKRTVYAEMGEILEWETSKFNDFVEAEEEENERFRRLKHAHFLALDELDKVNVDSPWVQRKIFGLINYRYKNRGNKLTLIASNTMPGELPEALRWLQSRLKDAVEIEIGGVDMRGEG